MRDSGTMLAGGCTALVLILSLQSSSPVAGSPLTCQDVPAILNGSHFVLRDSSTREGPMVRYVCDEGFHMTGPQDVACVRSNGSYQWMPDPPLCQAVVDCPELGALKNGYVEGDACCAPGDVQEFYCHEEFELDGPESVTCQLDGVWSAPMPTCRSVYCPDPGLSEKGNRVAVLRDDVYEGRCCPPETLMLFECHEGYELIGQKLSECGARSLWTSPRPLCKPVISCEDFEVEHGVVSGAKSEGDYYGLGDDVFVSCEEGYRIEGSDLLFCDEDGSWDAEPPQCVAYNCTRRDFGPHVVVPEFRDSNDTSFAVGTTIYFQCEEGYVLDGPSSTACRRGDWFGRPPKCHLVQCGALTAPENGWMTGGSTAVGSTVSFHCFQGYRRLGPRERQCFSNGQWGGDVVRCVSEASLSNRNACLDPGVPDNGVKMGSNYEVGNNVSFACNPGFHLRGEQSIRCNHDRKWSAPPPLCTGRFYFDKPWTIESSLRNHVTQVTRESAALNNNSEQLERSLNLNEQGVRHVVYFAFDASASIGLNNLKTGVGLAKAITRKINVTSNGHRVGAVRFNNTATLTLSPLTVTSTDAALRALDAVATDKTVGGTAIKAALTTITLNAQLVSRNLETTNTKLKFSVFFITDGKANLGGSPAKEVARFRRDFKAEIYCIGLTGSPDHKALEELASKPTEEHVFILRNYAVMQWLADHLTNGSTDYSVCGRSNKHMADTGLEVEDEKAEARIFGGQEVIESWPWMVEIRGDGDKLICGASIISSQWLLTAAHCLRTGKEKGYREKSRDEFKLRLGLTNRQNRSQEQEVFIEEIFRHKDYNATTQQNDIALLRLNQSISFNEFARPICLPPPQDRLSQRLPFYVANQSAFVIGWGAQKHGGKDTESLRQLKLRIQAQDHCKRKLQAQTYDDSMMCALGAEGKGRGDACKGDSGGPLMQGIVDDETVWTQVGIVSWGFKCDRSGKPGVYTNVAKYVPWIELVMARGRNASDEALPNPVGINA